MHETIFLVILGLSAAGGVAIQTGFANLQACQLVAEWVGTKDHWTAKCFVTGSAGPKP